jgi:hypothetical protein
VRGHLEAHHLAHFQFDIAKVWETLSAGEDLPNRDEINLMARPPCVKRRSVKQEENDCWRLPGRAAPDRPLCGVMSAATEFLRTIFAGDIELVDYLQNSSATS